MTELIDNIKDHSDRLSNHPNLSTLELSAILAKISKLAEETVILKFLCKQEQINDLTAKQAETTHSDNSEAEKTTDNEVRNTQPFQDLDSPTLEGEVLVEEKEKKSDESLVFNEVIVEQHLANAPAIDSIPVEEELKEEIEIVQENVADSEEDISISDIEAEEKIIGTQDLNEAFHEEDDHSLSEQLKKQAIPDLITAIGLNERYLYANELFAGDMEDFRTAIRILNEFETGEEAIKYFENELRRSYGWEDDNTLATALLLLVKRRFQ